MTHLPKTKEKAKVRLLHAYWHDQSGATAIEYGLIMAMVGVAIIGGLKAVGDGVNSPMNNVSEVLQKSADSQNAAN